MSTTFYEKAAWLSCIAVICCLPACSGNKSVPAPADDRSSCVTDADCADDSVCSVYSLCLPRYQGGLELGFQLTPQGEQAEGLRLAQQEIPPWEIEEPEGGQLHLVFPEAVRISGAVLALREHLSETTLRATVVALRASRIPGLPNVLTSLSVEGEGVEAVPDPSDVTPNWTLDLTQGVTYKLTVSPAAPYNATFPPSTMNRDFQADTTQDVVLGDPERTAYVSGVLTHALGEPVSGVSVSAVDENGGLFASSTGLTDENGVFMLSVPKGLRSYRFTFSPSEDNQAVPEVVHEGVVCCLENEGLSPEQPAALGSFNFPAFATPQDYHFQVLGLSSSGERVPVEAAQIRFETEVGLEGALTGSYLTTASTDASGMVVLSLIPGGADTNRLYRVSVIPALSSPYRATSREMQIGPMSGAGEPILLARRVAYSAWIEAEHVSSLADISVLATRLDLPEGFPGELRSAVTAEDGRFVLMLDPGRYSFEFIPPAGYALPTWALHQLLVGQGSESVQSGGTFSLPEASVLDISVRSAVASAQLLPGVSVTTYLVDPRCATEDTEVCDLPSIALAQGVTDDDGQVSLILPRAW